MSSRKRPPTRQQPTDAGPRVEALATWLEDQPDARERFRWVLRDSLDELLAGQRTGRWCYQELKKTEKTYLGTAIEINLANEFDFPEGADLDWNINGNEVDCKFSKNIGGWEIPMEMYTCEDHGEQNPRVDHLALLLWINDDDSQWAAGVIEIRDCLLKFKVDKHTGEKVRQYNRDNKRRLDDDGIKSIRWLWGGLQEDLPENVLRQMNAATRRVVLSGSGQDRVNALFREVERKLITRSTILTVAPQADPMKRVRDARLSNHLGGEGYLILGHQAADPDIACCLGLPIPAKGEFVSCRVSPGTAESKPSVWLGDGWWRLANSADERGPSPDRDLYRNLDLRSLRSG